MIHLYAGHNRPLRGSDKVTAMKRPIPKLAIIFTALMLAGSAGALAHSGGGGGGGGGLLGGGGVATAVVAVATVAVATVAAAAVAAAGPTAPVLPAAARPMPALPMVVLRARALPMPAASPMTACAGMAIMNMAPVSPERSERPIAPRTAWSITAPMAASETRSTAPSLIPRRSAAISIAGRARPGFGRRRGSDHCSLFPGAPHFF